MSKKKVAAEPDPAPGAHEARAAEAVVGDRTLPIPHVDSDRDALVSVPSVARTYGVVMADGRQYVHTPVVHDEYGPVVRVNEPDVDRFLFAVEGSKVVLPPGAGAGPKRGAAKAASSE